ncbi:MAG: Virulence sensor protein BvgS precursor [Syntrophus sp. PtaU1.Bin208]|nr:MAG: Virulence sensor protein BvgS precursor [Syntrophus sp. PtaU1.Bin208]
MQNSRQETKTKGTPNIEVGCGVACGEDSYAAGRDAMCQATGGISSYLLTAVIVFAPASYHLDAMLSGIRSVVGDVPLFGASSAGEICNGAFSGSIVVLALASPFLSVRVGVGKGVSADYRKALSEAIENGRISRYFNPQDSAVYNEMTCKGRSAFAFLFSPGSTADSECHSPEILEELKGLSCGRIPFFGGCAIDTLGTTGQENFVFCGNQACPDSMVLAVFETGLKFGIAMGHGFQPSAKKAVVTKSRHCDILEMDGKPAADVFSALHNLPRESLEGRYLFEQTVSPFGMRHSLGQYTIFVPQNFTSEGGVRLAHPAPEGTSLVLMEAIEDEVIAAGKDTLQHAMTQSGIAESAAILVCSCFLRKKILKDRYPEELTAITDIMPGVPMVGFYGAGEQGTNADHVSRHNNETIAILLLGNELSYAAKVAEENRILYRMLEARLAEKQLLETELAGQIRFLQTLIDNIPNPVFYKDPEGLYLGCNKAFEEYFHVRREKILGSTVLNLNGVPQIERHHKLDAKLIANGGRVVYEFMIPSEEGKVLHNIVHKAFFYKGDASPGGIVGCITDITELKRAEEVLRISEEKFLKAFQSIPTMMTINTYLDGKIVEVNESYLHNLGFARQEVLGRTSQELQVYAYPEHRDLVIRMIVEKGTVLDFTVPLRTKDGNIRHCLLSAERIQLQNVEHVLILLQDITEQKLAEEERLQRMQLHSILDMAGTICHEMNQPLQILSGYTELLMTDPALDPKLQKKLQTIQEQTARMERITRKLLTINDCSFKDYAGIAKIMDIHDDKRE